MTVTIFDIAEMTLHDGPGVRTTVFLKGCPLRCKWCHNPEGLKSEIQLMYKENKCIHCGNCLKPCNHPQCKDSGKCILSCPEDCFKISGEVTDTNSLAKRLKNTADIMGNSFGGFTFSGGEPLYQYEAVIELCKELEGYHLCIETSGYADEDVFRKVIQKMDFVIMDIKIADDILHKKYTGVSNQKILKNLEILKGSNKDYIIRTPLIPHITDTKENLNAIKEIIGKSNWEHIPYNNLTQAKYKMLGLKYEL